MATAVDPQELEAQTHRETFAQQFTKMYYQTFDSNRTDLMLLYRPTSLLTFQSQLYRGPQAIVDKLMSLGFSRIQHQTSTIDTQATGDGIIVMVTGQLLVDEEQRPMNFCQTFCISHDTEYFVKNDLFALVFG